MLSLGYRYSHICFPTYPQLSLPLLHLFTPRIDVGRQALYVAPEILGTTVLFAFLLSFCLLKSRYTL